MEIINTFGFDIRAITAQLINFAIFFFIFRKFIAKPFMKYLKEEKNKEQEKERLLKELQTRDEELKKEKDEIINNAHKESARILAESKKFAEEQKAEILEQAQKESIALKEKVQAQLEAEKETMYRDVKDYIVKSSSEMTKAVLREFLNEDDQKKILEKMERKIKIN